MLHLSATEHDRDLDLVTLTEELGDLAGLGVEVATADLRAVLHLLDHDVGRLLAGLLGPLLLLVLELGEVHDPAHRWTRIRRDLDQVELHRASDVQRLGKRLDAQLRPLGVDQSNLSCTDPVVDPCLVSRCSSYFESLLNITSFLQGSRPYVATASRCLRRTRATTRKRNGRMPEHPPRRNSIEDRLRN